MLDFYIHRDEGLPRKRNWTPRQKMWRVDDDHSLKRMQFEAAYYGLLRDQKYDMRSNIYQWYGWHDYFSWRNLPRDCTQLMSLYVSEIHSISERLKGQPARCVSILLRADQAAILPVRVEQAGALLGILKTVDDRDAFRETLANYIATRPDFEMQGAAFGLTEVGAANFCMKMIASGMIPGMTGWHDVQMQRVANQHSQRVKKNENNRNLFEGMVNNNGFV